MIGRGESVRENLVEPGIRGTKCKHTIDCFKISSAEIGAQG